MIYETSYAGGIGYIPKDGGPGAPKEARQKDKILSTEGENFFENKFCYHSFRFAFLENCDLSKIKKVQATYVHTDLKIIGHFNSSNEKLNKLFDSAMRTKLNNVHGIFEDCARERLDYGGDIVALANSNLYTFDLNSFYKKIIGDFNSQQTKDGGFPETAPYMGIQTNGTGEKEGPLLWQLAVPYMLIKHYQFYGEVDLLKSNYKNVKKQVDYLLSKKIDWLADRCIGDHGSILIEDFYSSSPDKLFVGYCSILLFIKSVQKISKIIGKENDYRYYSKKLKENKRIVEEKFSNKINSSNMSQSGLIFALLANLGTKKILAKRLSSKIKEDGGIFTTGIFGMAAEYHFLHEFNQDKKVLNWLEREEKPSFLNMLASGNKTLSELFIGKNYSLNHAMFSSYIYWFYQALGGIEIDDDAKGCSKIKIKPFFDKRVANVSIDLNTVKGKVSSTTYIKDNKMHYLAKIPKKIKYQLDLPKNAEVEIKEQEQLTEIKISY